jgi:LmbE family N-acetylglucosaminyl deacetylase
MGGGILAIVSHPDDETFGCGGTLAMHAMKGVAADVLCLTCNPRDRRGEILWAAEALGISESIVFEEDNVAPDPALTRRVSDVIVSLRPRVVITHVSFDYHAEHRVTHELVKEAIEWAAHTTTYPEPCLVERLLLMEVNTLIPSPHVLVDVSEAMDRKRSAMDRYASQLAKFPWGYYQRFNLKKAELRGVQGKCDHAEAFLEEPLAQSGPFYEAKSVRSLV